MNSKKNEISDIVEYINSLVRDTESLEEDIKLIKIGINRLQNTATELETFANRIQTKFEQTILKINQTMGYFLNQIQNSKDIEIKTKESDVKEENKKAVKTSTKSKQESHPLSMNNKTLEKIETAEKDKSPEGVMILICPVQKSKRRGGSDSTCVTRRQLVPTTEEEKMILNYLIRCNHKPTQKEYNRLYKEVCNMLLKAPKNAIAIEICTADPRSEKKYIEIFYHINIRGKRDYACVNYVEITGVEAYRVRKE